MEWCDPIHHETYDQPCLAYKVSVGKLLCMEEQVYFAFRFEVKTKSTSIEKILFWQWLNRDLLGGFLTKTQNLTFGETCLNHTVVPVKSVFSFESISAPACNARYKAFSRTVGRSMWKVFIAHLTTSGLFLTLHKFDATTVVQPRIAYRNCLRHQEANVKSCSKNQTSFNHTTINRRASFLKQKRD